MANKQKKPKIEGGYPYPFLVNLGIIMVFGLLMLFSASYTTGYQRFGDSYHFISSQAMYAVMGVAVMFVISRFDYHRLHKWTWFAYLFTLVLLGLVLACDPINNCRRWLHWDSGPLAYFPSVQVSEIGKFVIILTTAWIMKRYRAQRGSFLRGFLLPLLPLVPVVVLLYFEPHLSGIILMCAIVGSIMLLGGAGLVWMLGGVGVLVVGYAALQGLAAELISYVGDRFAGWTDDLSQMAYQTRQSLYAIGSGGLTGLGLGNSLEKQLWLPECTNDFIYSVVCEELGFVGAVTVILLFVGLIVQCLYIAYTAADIYGTFIALGITAQITWQVVFNIAVVTNSVPNTGISLPFFSSGGTSLLMLLAEMGVLLNIARQGAQAAAIRREKAEAARLAAEAQAGQGGQEQPGERR